jgi:hypothetical protein
MKLVEVEYTKEVQRYSGHEKDFDGNDTAVTIAEGTRFKVDPVSAKSLVDRGVAKLVGDADQKSEARAAVKAAAADGAK